LSIDNALAYMVLSTGMLLKKNRCCYSLVLIVSIMTASGCSPVKQLLDAGDSAPDQAIDPATIKDAVPREVTVTRAGNKNPYTVLGKTYHLLPSSEGYSEEGVASWYGTKFHGRPTANGEPYSIYGMTAAHRTLPIPVYVKVTNLENDRTVIVRVNDRGPFHSGRVIDLSYAAAVKLGYDKQGVAKVLVEVIDSKTDPVKTEPVETAVIAQPERYYLQVGAFKSLESATKLQTKVISSTKQLVQVKASEPAGFYRVQLGPLNSIEQVQQVTEKLVELNIKKSQLIIE
jgi:rare lipoprotein A